MYKVDLAGGKYTLTNNNGIMSCLRHGETWRESIIDNVMLALIHDHEELAEENARLRKIEESNRQTREVKYGDYVYLSEKYPRELVGKEHNSSKGLIGIGCARIWLAEGKARIVE